MGARTTALAALIACRKQGAWADGVLKDYIARDKLDRREAALASRLCYGVLQNRMLLDHYLDCCLNGPIKKLQPVVLDILRLGAYQLLLMDKIPVSAAVNEAVEQAKKYANRSASGLVNGVLRRLAREGEQLPAPDSLAVRYSHPQPLVDLLREAVGADRVEALLASHNEAPPTILQLNRLAADPHQTLSALQEHGALLTSHPWLEDSYFLTGGGSPEHLPGFREGAFFVQDPAARLSVLAAGLQPGMKVLDCCSAPGGKSFAAAMAMENRGSICSCDIHPHKITLIEKGAERLGITICEPTLQDASTFVPQWEQAFDAVIADVPCSGLGVIRKKPDIRYKDLQDIRRLPDIQHRILDNVCRYVKPGGVLLYSTCTILPAENELQMQMFLNTHPNFTAEAFSVPDGLPEGDNNGMLTLLPSIHGTDGFFICKLRRTL